MRLIVTSLMLFSAAAFAKPPPGFKNSSWEAKGVGTVTFKHQDIGEPVAQPEKLEVFLKCGKSKTAKLVEMYRMCQFTDYEYEAGIKTLHLTMTAGRVEPTTGKVTCDRLWNKDIDLSKACPTSPK